MKYKINKHIILLLRLVIFIALLWLLLKNITGNFYYKSSSQDFFKKGILSIFAYDHLDNVYLDIIKLLTTSSVYLLGFLNVTLFMSDLSDTYFQVVKYQSQTRCQYMRHCFTLITVFYLEDIFVWLVGLLSLIFYFKELDFLVLLGQMTINHLLWFFVISCVNRNTTIVMLSVFQLFLFQQILIDYFLWSLLLATVLIYLLSYFNFGVYLRGDES